MYAGVFSRVESGDGGSAGSFHHSLCRICDDKADEHVESAEGERVYSGGDFDRALWAESDSHEDYQLHGVCQRLGSGIYRIRGGEIF